MLLYNMYLFLSGDVGLKNPLRVLTDVTPTLWQNSEVFKTHLRANGREMINLQIQSLFAP